jgi:spermidine synthase
MTVVAVYPSSKVIGASTLFAGAIFTSAMLVFSVQPMIAKMILPQLGGSPAVWNASMAFFQAALLCGYAYAHLLQRLPSLRSQVLVHMTVLALAAVVLPLKVTGVLGEAPATAPVPWLLGVLALSVGAPFAALSATAPLAQAWFARSQQGRPEAENPYVLYAASNVGSMLALLSYPVLIEPLLALKSQTLLWTIGYGAFVILLGGVAHLVWRTQPAAALVRASEPPAAVAWKDRLLWIALAAAPSSLMLGVTTHISTDVASAPFLWVLPLALYLLTFVIAFQAKPVIPPHRAVLWQTAFILLCFLPLGLSVASWTMSLVLHLGAFFLTALVCHHALVARRPNSAHLTEFYLLMSVGGVIGGAFNAFVAPAVFETVLEYPIVLALACLARPWSARPSMPATGLAAAGVALALTNLVLPETTSAGVRIALLLASAGVAATLHRQTLLFAVLVGALALTPVAAQNAGQTVHRARSFFGVHKVEAESLPQLGGPVHLLVHGTTYHGAQPLNPALRCTPTNYYAAVGPIGQTYTGLGATRSRLNIGVVGLGGGAVAAFSRPGDRMRFFEIDPEVERIARDERYFSYLSECAQGPTDVVLGDARLTVAREPRHSYDLIHLDAFTSDSVPTHLLTAQALQIYFDALKPDGVLMLHISNRNMALEGPAAAAGQKIGAQALIQNFRVAKDAPKLVANSTDVMILSKSAAALEPFRRDPRWREAKADQRAWTDDYTNVVGAVVAKMRQ